MNKTTKKILFPAMAAGICVASAAAPRHPKALVIMLDGLRADAVENADAANLRMLRDGEWQPRPGL